MPKAKKEADESAVITDVITIERFKEDGKQKVKVALMSGNKKVGEEIRNE